MTVALAFLLLLGQAAAQAPQNTTPTLLVTPPPPDPATSAFTGDAGLILVAIKPAATADYELVIRTLNEALVKDADPALKAAAKGWRVLKATEADAKGNTLYVHIMLPAVPAFDYRPSLLVDALVKELTPGLLGAYQDAFAGPPSKLNLTELANMSVAPLPPAVAVPVTPPEVKKPGGE